MSRRSGRRLVARVTWPLLAAVLVGSLTAAPASAATLVGSTFAPTNFCNPNITTVQTPSPAYAVPVAGVITSWQFQAGASVPQLKFKVFRPTGGTSYTVIGSSDVVTPAASATSSFLIRVPVQPGDVIGETVVTMGNCLDGGSGTSSYVVGDAAVGSTMSYGAGNGTLDLAAVVEPDVDGDGYGDQTQDGCASQVGAHGQCDTTAPDTRFTAGPTKTRKRKVTFAFTSDDPAASYQCRLTGKRVSQVQIRTFQPCTSPKKYKHLKPGRYTLTVLATDPLGNVETTPATLRLKIKSR